MKTVKHLLLLLAVVLCFCTLASCQNGGGPTAVPTTAPITTPPPVKLSAPVVVLTEDTATWNADALADKFEISINGVLSYLENSMTSYKLADGQTFKIRAIGDGIHYTTSDWSNAVVYTAPVTYTVTWKNGDTVLETDENVAIGAIPAYDGVLPTKEATAQYRYEFAGWSPAIAPANSDVTYTAIFDAVVNEYTVVWKNGDLVLETDTVAYGTMPEYNGAEPTKAPDNERVYVFNSWTPVVNEVTGDITYQAQFVVADKTCKVVFCDEDGTIISEQIIAYGKNAVPPEEPEKEDGGENYRFLRWDKAFHNITEDTTITAIYAITFNVQFLDYDGSVIYSTHIVKGHTFTDIPADPVRDGYEFLNWSTDDFSDIQEDLTVYAEYVRIYVVAFIDHNGTSLDVQNVRTGENATAPEAPTREGYDFVGWDIAYENVTSDLTVTAMYKVKYYTVTFISPDGIVISQKTVKHGNPVIAPTVAEAYFDWNAKKGYGFSGWDQSFDTVIADMTISAVYEEEIKAPIIVVEVVQVPLHTTNMQVRVFMYVNGTDVDKVYGVSLDIAFDKMLQKDAPMRVEVNYQFGMADDNYTSKLIEDETHGTYELRWAAKNENAVIHFSKNQGYIRFLTFNVQLDGQQATGTSYLIEILESTYFIDENLEKVHPVIISGSVIISNK